MTQGQSTLVGRHATVVASAATALAYGLVLPVLPVLIARLADIDAAPLTGRLMAVYSLAVIVSAPLWGWLCSGMGAVRVLRVGLIGQIGALAFYTLPPTLASLITARALQGLFAGAVLPALLAQASQVALDEADRSQRFADVVRGGLLGGLFGPGLGGVLASDSQLQLPALAGLAALAVATAVAWRIPSLPATAQVVVPRAVGHRGELLVWLALGALAAAAMSVYEVGLTTRGRLALGLTARDIGLMFSGCGVVMLLAQMMVFHRGHDPVRAFGWVAPAFAATAAGLAILAAVDRAWGTTAGIVLVAAGAGVLQPALTYWTSRTAGGGAEGMTLGLRTAVTTAGQALGSLAGGYAFTATATGRALLAIGLVLLGLASITTHRLRRRLVSVHDASIAPRSVPRNRHT
ncbi:MULTISPECIES: MFS transporter [Rhodanobacter]|uniref:MFS transporter n=1 Tax=Rhodanobacter TaxID=75309 RepID=UPI0004845EC3|nr:MULTISPECIES: MFS transporter [Rhodanobacter]UJJ53534.1 MFS transporter [Rhodanobacter thiooxydans]